MGRGLAAQNGVTGGACLGRRGSSQGHEHVLKKRNTGGDYIISVPSAIMSKKNCLRVCVERVRR